MPKKTITQLTREREAAAIRSARWRETHRNRPDVRAVDKSISEAVALYGTTLPPEEAKAFLQAIVEAAAAGLAFQDYSAPEKRVALRLQNWLGSTLTSGGVRAARYRAEGVAASRSDSDSSPVTSSYGDTAGEAA